MVPQTLLLLRRYTGLSRLRARGSYKATFSLCQSAKVCRARIAIQRRKLLKVPSRARALADYRNVSAALYSLYIYIGIHIYIHAFSREKLTARVSFPSPARRLLYIHLLCINFQVPPSRSLARLV